MAAKGNVLKPTDYTDQSAQAADPVVVTVSTHGGFQIYFKNSHTTTGLQINKQPEGCDSQGQNWEGKLPGGVTYGRNVQKRMQDYKSLRVAVMIRATQTDRHTERKRDSFFDERNR